MLYTIGEFAKKSGVTLRTLRYYDKINLFKPSGYTSSGHRLYSSSDFVKLQKIVTLKYIGLSLNDICHVIQYDMKDDDIKKSLEIQRNIMTKKAHHISMVIEALDEAITMVETEKELNWNKLTDVIKLMNMDSNWMEQYQTASNLRSRIHMHELYSTNPEGWMRWYFRHMDIPPGSTILEVGCGDASLWEKNIDRIDSSLDITLTDFSSGMLSDAERSLRECPSKANFKFQVVDAEDIPFEDESFDIVLANHMLYHVPDIDRALSEIKRVLRKGGILYASTVGVNHMKELLKLSESLGIAPTKKPIRFTTPFQLENAGAILSKYFNNITVERYPDNLLVTDASAICDYIFSIPGNSKEKLSPEKLASIYVYLEERIKKDGSIFITKDTGYFKAFK